MAGPTLYVSDTYHDRVLKIEYSATAHGVPPKVTEFVTGLNQPWDVIPVGTQLYVSDRMNNAIKVFDMDTGALVKSIAVAQPEGMALLDGWLYYAKRAHQVDSQDQSRDRPGRADRRSERDGIQDGLLHQRQQPLHEDRGLRRQLRTARHDRLHHVEQQLLRLSQPDRRRPPAT